MWTERRIVSVDAWSWTLLGLWAWFWPGVGLVLAKGLAGVLVLLIAMLGRVVAMIICNRMARWHQGVHIVQDSGALLKIRLALSWRALGLYAGVTGGVLGVGVWGVLGPMPFWWVFVVAGVSIAAQVITLILYNGIVVPFYGGWQWHQQVDHGKFRILNFTPNQTRLLFATLLFAWTAVILVVWIGLGLLFFAAIHKALPQGFFSLGLIVFSSFLAAIIGFVLSVALSWWFFWGATWYNRWANHGGGVQMTAETTTIAL